MTTVPATDTAIIRASCILPSPSIAAAGFVYMMKTMTPGRRYWGRSTAHSLKSRRVIRMSFCTRALTGDEASDEAFLFRRSEERVEGKGGALWRGRRVERKQ